MNNVNHRDSGGSSNSALESGEVMMNSSTPRSHTAHNLSSASSYADLHYLFAPQDTLTHPVKPVRNRRRSAPDSTKHRRTRSGCFTCRSRRVKCDEGHPTCERCKKGSRECVYPETSTGSKKSGNSASRIAQSASSSDSEDGDSERLDAIPDDEEMTDDVSRPLPPSRSVTQRSNMSQSNSDLRSGTRNSSETPSSLLDKSCTSPTPSTEGSVINSKFQSPGRQRNSSNSPTSESSLRSDWSHLPSDLQYNLAYFYDNLTHCHYSMKFDSCDFLHTHFLDAALRNDALLHAVVGFSAFHRTLHNPSGKIQDFLQYYNKSVSLLLNSLRNGDKRDTGILLAILQLATIEEYLGDWINLLGHQKAAYEILTELYNPHTVMEDEKARVILGWYCRFDVFAGLMGGFETVLSREWFQYSQDYLAQQVHQEPQELVWKIEHALAQQRLIAMDMSLLFSKNGKGEISYNDFVKENESVARRIGEWIDNMDPVLRDPRYLANDFSGARDVDADDIVDPYLQDTIYQGKLYPMNFARLDMKALSLMHRYRTALFMKTEPSGDLTTEALEVCQLFEAIEFYPGSPRGAVLAAQASIAIASLFLPRDETHAMWSRRKFATIESHGYIYPHTFRNEMANLFRDRSCLKFWLPNDECCPPVVRSIKQFVEERSTPAKNVSDQEDLRDMKAIFSALNLDDEEENSSLNSTGRKPSIIDTTLTAGHDAHIPQGSRVNANARFQGNVFGMGGNAGRGSWAGQQGNNPYEDHQP